MNIVKPACRFCRKGSLVCGTKTQTFYPNKKKVEVELLTAICDHCGVESLLADQHKENLRRLQARKAHYGSQLLGEEYLSFRKRYGLTQKQAAKLIGKGLIAFSRYENEVTYPDDTTRLLIELAMTNPAVLEKLAEKAGIVIPLWTERCEDVQKKIVRPILVKTELETVTDVAWSPQSLPTCFNEPLQAYL